jgi:hypothetical protein
MQQPLKLNPSRGTMKNNFEYEVIIYGQPIQVKDLKEAQDRMKRVEYSDFAVSYIVRKEYTPNGKLVEEVMIG